MQSLVNSDKNILFSEIAEALGITGQLSTADLLAGGAHIPITVTGAPAVVTTLGAPRAPVSMSAIKAIKVPYTPASATFNLDLPYDETTVDSFVAKFKTDVAAKLGINPSSIAIVATPTPDGSTTLQTTVKLPFNSNIAASVVDNLNIIQTTTDPTTFLSPSTVQMLATPAISTAFVPPPIATAPPDALPLGSTSLANDTFTIDLSTYFQSTPGVPLLYALEGNPFSNASLSNGILTVHGSQMDSNYNIRVVASTPNGQVSRASLAVTEVSPAAAPALAARMPPTVVTPLGLFTLSDQQPTASYNLSNVFADPQDSPLFYSLASNPVGSASLSASGILSLSGSMRDTTYPVTVAATNIYGRRADSTLSVTELAPPMPIATSMGGISLSSGTCNIPLDPFFADSTGRGLTYALASNPKGSAIVAGGQLSVAGKLRGSTYSVVVAAKNVYGGRATSALSVVETTGSKAPTTVGTLGSVTLGKNAYTIDVRPAFSDPIGVGMAYTLSGSNAFGAAALTQTGVLTVQGASRNTTYSVGVQASNAAGSAVQSMTVIETAPNAVITPPTVAVPLGSRTLSNTAQVSVSLANTFAGSSRTYSLVANPYSNASISGSALMFAGNFRGSTYSIVVAASNAAGRALSTMSVTEAASTVVGTSLGSVTLDSSRVASSNVLSSYFTDSTSSGLTYRVSYNPFNNASISASGVLTVYGAFRGTSYNVSVTARNTRNASATSTLLVTEAAAPVTPKLTGVPAVLGGSTNSGSLTFPMAGYQTATGVGTLNWSLGGAQIAGLTINATTGVLTAAKGTVASGQVVTVVAANQGGLFSSAPINVTFTCIRVSATIPATTAPLTSASPSLVIALTSCFVDNLGSGLTYSLTSNPLSTASISGSTLTITTANSGSSYAVVVAATDANGFVSTLTVSVSETKQAPSSVGSVAPIVAASTSNLLYPMASYFSMPYGGLFSITSNPLGNATIGVTSGLMSVAPSGSNNIYKINVQTSDAYNQTAHQAVSVMTLVAPATSATVGPIAIASTSNVSLPMSSSFSLSPYASNTYGLVSNPQSNAAVLASTGALTIVGAGCNAQYNVGVRVTDNVGQDATQSVTVTSLVAPVLSGTPLGTSNTFPTAAMTANTTSISGSNYVASSSSTFASGTYEPWKAFSRSASSWYASSPVYRADGTYNGTVSTVSSGTTYSGEWLQLAMPAPISLTSFTIKPWGNDKAAPATWVLCGSVNGSLWTTLHVQSVAQPMVAGTTYSYTVSPPSDSSSYSYFRLVMRTNNANNDLWTGMDEMTFTGTPMGYPSVSATIASSSNASIPLASSFITSPYAIKTYTVTSNPQSNAAVDASSGVLTLAGSGCNAQYTIGVSISDQVGQSATQPLTVTSLIQPTPSGSIGPVSIASTSNLTVPMSSKFVLSSFASNTYAMASNPQSNASIAANGTLSLAGSGCNAQYSVGVKVTDNVGQSAAQFFTVSSLVAPTTNGSVGPLTIASASNVSIPLAGKFNLSAYTTNAYSMTMNPQSNASVAPDGTLTVAGSGCNAQYSMAVRVTDDVGQSVTQSLTVTSLIQPTPSGSIGPVAIASTSNLTVPMASKFVLSSFASNAYAMASNPQSNASVAANGTLSLAGSGCNAQYSVGVKVTDNVGQSAAQFFTVSSLVAPTTNGSVGPLTIASASNVSIPLAGKFNLSAYTTNAYSMTTNPQSNASVAPDGTLTVAGSGCNAQYSMAVRVTDDVGQSATQSLTVTSLIQPTPSGSIGPVAIASTSNLTVSMASKFVLSSFASNTYAMASNPQSNASVAANGTLTLAGSGCNAQYSVGVKVTDNVAQSASQFFTVSSLVAPTTNGSVGPLTIASASNVSIPLAGKFNLSAYATNAYAMASNPQSNASVASDGTLTVAGSGCNAQYNVGVRVTDNVGQSAAQYLTLTSIVPPTASGSIDTVTVSSTCNVSITLPSYFATSAYATPTYMITSNPQSNATLSSSNVLSIVAGTAGQYSVGVKLTDQVGQFATQTIPVVQYMLTSMMETVSVMFGRQNETRLDRLGNILNYCATWGDSNIPAMTSNATRGWVADLSSNMIGVMNPDGTPVQLDQSYTKMYWINPNNTWVTGFHHVMSSWDQSYQIPSATWKFGYHETYIQGGWMYHGHYGGSNGVNNNYQSIRTSSVVLPSVGQWTHVAVTYDNPTTTLRTYINGALDNTVTNTNLSWKGSTCGIVISGINKTNGGYTVRCGQLDNIRVFSGALSSSNIAAIYAADLNPPTAAFSQPGRVYLTSPGRVDTVLGPSMSISYSLSNYFTIPSGGSATYSIPSKFNPQSNATISTNGVLTVTTGAGRNASYTINAVATDGNYGNLTYQPFSIVEIPSNVFASLATATVNAAVAIYGLKLYKTYSGAIISIRRSSDNLQQDFYGTITGTLNTLANGTGSSYSAWLGAATGYVVTWYDQSGAGAHISQTNNSYQPVLTTAGKLVFNGTTQYLEKAYSSSVNTASFTYIVRCACYNTDNTHQSPITSRGDSSGYTLYKHPDNVFNHWNGYAGSWQTLSSGVTCVQNTVYNIAGTYNGTTMTSTVNGVSASTGMQLTLNTTSPMRIGAGDTAIPTPNFYWNGEISTVMYFNTAISAADRDLILNSA